MLQVDGPESRALGWQFNEPKRVQPQQRGQAVSQLLLTKGQSYLSSMAWASASREKII